MLLRRHSIRISALFLSGLLMLLTACSLSSTEPPLHDAAFRGDLDKVTNLLESGEKVDSLNSEGATPLHWAAFKGHVDIAKLLLSKGADVNAKTKKGSTPLRLATTHKQDAMVRLLKMRGGRVE